MIRVPKSALSLGTVALGVSVLTLSVPRAAKAVAAALVQVTNTVTTQETSRQAIQLVHLTAELNSDKLTNFSLVTTTGDNGSAYNVPSTASLVINTVDFTPAIDSAGLSFAAHLLGGSFSALNLAVPGQPIAQFATVHFNYPSGIVIGPGFTPAIQLEANGSGNDVFVDLFGYLTTN